jgi:hypothetical protein
VPTFGIKKKDFQKKLGLLNDDYEEQTSTLDFMKAVEGIEDPVPKSARLPGHTISSENKLKNKPGRRSVINVSGKKKKN